MYDDGEIVLSEMDWNTSKSADECIAMIVEYLSKTKEQHEER